MIGIIDNSDMIMTFNRIVSGIEIKRIVVDNDENDTVIEDTVIFESNDYRHNMDPLDSDNTIWVKENSELHKYLESNIYQDIMYGSAKYYKEYTPTTIDGISIGCVDSIYDQKKNDFYNNFIIIKDADKTRIKKHGDTVCIPFILLSVMNIHPSIVTKDRNLTNDQIDFVYVRGINQNIVDALLDSFNASIYTRDSNMKTPASNDGSSISSDVLLYNGSNKFDFFCNIFKLINIEDTLNKKVSVLAHLKY